MVLTCVCRHTATWSSRRTIHFFSLQGCHCKKCVCTKKFRSHSEICSHSWWKHTVSHCPSALHTLACLVHTFLASTCWWSVHPSREGSGWLPTSQGPSGRWAASATICSQTFRFFKELMSQGSNFRHRYTCSEGHAKRRFPLVTKLAKPENCQANKTKPLSLTDPSMLMGPRRSACCCRTSTCALEHWVRAGLSNKQCSASSLCNCFFSGAAFLSALSQDQCKEKRQLNSILLESKRLQALQIALGLVKSSWWECHVARYTLAMSSLGIQNS